MKHEDIKVGQHCWAIMGKKLLIVLKVDESCYDVCGGWECAVGSDALEFIEIIEPPSNCIDMPLYYL